MESPINLCETVQRIKKAGKTKVRAVPMTGQDFQSGQYAIEVCEGGQWTPIVEGLSSGTANSIINQALNRVICG